jgi:hypothetical protein
VVPPRAPSFAFGVAIVVVPCGGSAVPPPRAKRTRPRREQNAARRALVCDIVWDGWRTSDGLPDLSSLSSAELEAWLRDLQEMEQQSNSRDPHLFGCMDIIRAELTARNKKA